jgi:hydroxyacylglutathione hydrolase
MPGDQHFKITNSLWRVTNRPFVSNTYIALLEDHKCLIIDPGLDRDAIDTLLVNLGVLPIAVLCTHGHFDHVGSAHDFADKYKVAVYLNASDQKVANTSNFLLMAFKIEARITLPKFELLQVSAENPSVEITLDNAKCQYLHIPGHTPGSCAVRVGDYLFTGDTLYARGVGLVSLPGEDVALLKKSIRFLFKHYEGQNVLVCPGHGEFDYLEGIKEKNEALKQFLSVDSTS